MNDPGMNDPRSNDAAATFEDHRRLLVGAAYRLLGSHSDAEDVVQEVWIRWSTVDASTIDEPRAYLLTITTRLALNRLRQLRTRRESYVGPWLPEPVSSDPRDDGAAAAELADDVSMAMLIVLESLSPLERAAFVLADVFGMPSGEVAGALDRSPAAVRQLVHRARSHIEARQPRTVVDTARHREVTERFLAAATNGDLAGLVAVLSPDVTLVTDGGGVRRAALRPIHSADKVIRWLFGVMGRRDAEPVTARLQVVNGETAVVLDTAEGIDSVWFVTVEDDRVSEVHAIRNPDKLGAIT
ncbi:ECF subfamily RNA polymerase sigma-24 subunit [Intrasporangium oryzae NRRL B-24470]|uniref:ECF subfamily RNA polymerase sigma-24 subunit n=2 Tax=Intrasporangium TaxID=53357 RepID=W9G6V6_9MICO|nr:ECF subfamily RNA polymerase sigma-24 subunit [Intrasporangium oryzae NRRL B-24470]